MKKYKEVNLEEMVSSWDEALRILKREIEYAKPGNIGCIMFIHGYGSSGKGGIIRKKARLWLNAQVSNKLIKAVINGEDFNIFNFDALNLKNKYKELEPLLKVTNHGVTIIEL